MGAVYTYGGLSGVVVLFLFFWFCAGRGLVFLVGVGRRLLFFWWVFGCGWWFWVERFGALFSSFLFFYSWVDISFSFWMFCMIIINYISLIILSISITVIDGAICRKARPRDLGLGLMTTLSIESIVVPLQYGDESESFCCLHVSLHSTDVLDIAGLGFHMKNRSVEFFDCCYECTCSWPCIRFCLHLVVYGCVL